MHRYYQEKLKELDKRNQLPPKENDHSTSSTHSNAITPSSSQAGSDKTFNGFSCLKIRTESPPSSHGTDLNSEKSLDSRATAKKFLDPSYFDTVLTPYYKANKYPSDSERQNISLETEIPVDAISDWYFEQWRKWGCSYKVVQNKKGKTSEAFDDKIKWKPETKVFERVTFNEKVNELLYGFYLYNPVPSLKLKVSISKTLKINFWAVEELFSKMRATNEPVQASKANYQQAVTDLENGFAMEAQDLECFHGTVRRNKKFTEEENNFLKEFFYNDPYPKKKLTVWMCMKMKCKFGRVSLWFLKMRAKLGEEYNKQQTLASAPAAQKLFVNVKVIAQPNQGASTSGFQSQSNFGSHNK